MGNICKCCTEQAETIEVESQQSSQGRDVVLVLPKIVVIDENDREHEIYNPDAEKASEREREKVESLDVKLASPKRKRPRRQQLMLVKPPSIEEEPGPSGMELRRRSSSSRGMGSASGMLIHQLRAGIPSSSILSEDPIVEAASAALKSRPKPKLDLSLEKMAENRERIRELAAQLGFSPESPGTPTEGLLSPMSPVDQYTFSKFTGKCTREKKRRRSWW